MATTDGSLDFVTFQDQVEAWMAAETGLRVYWENQDRNWEQAKAWGLLNIVAVVDNGVDDERYRDHPSPSAGAELERNVGGLRHVTVSVRVQSRTQRPADQSARWYLEKLRTSLRDPQVRRTYFAPFDINLIRMLSFQNLDFTEQRRTVSLGNMDVLFATTANRLGTETYVETIEVSSDVSDPDGNPISPSLQLDDVVMP